MLKVLISMVTAAGLVACTTEPQKVVAVYQNYTVCPPDAQLNADSRLITATQPAGTQQVVTLTNGLRCVYIVPAQNLQAQQ